jgi:hypothetical protein
VSTFGFPDGQEITQWLGQPLEVGTGKVIGAGSYVAGPFALANFASVIVAVKPTGGNVTVTVKQTVQGGPASLVLSESVVVANGGVLFEAFVLFGDTITVEFDGTAAGETIDYAIYPSNTTTNAQVITQATINVQHNDLLVAAEPTIDFEDATGFAWTIVDDAAGTRVKVTPPTSPLVPIADLVLPVDTALPLISGIPGTYKHLRLIARYAVAAAAGNGWQALRFNGITANAYGVQTGVDQGAARSSTNFGTMQSAICFSQAWGRGGYPTAFSWATVDIPDYTDAADAPRMVSQFGAIYADAASSGGANGFLSGQAAGFMDRTLGGVGPITSLGFVDLSSGSNFKAGSRFTLYGYN